MRIQSNDFEEWLIHKKGISQISAQKYSRAVVTIFNWAERDFQKFSFSTVVEFDQLRSSELENQKFFSNDKRGHRMYSVALNHFRDYVLTLK